MVVWIPIASPKMKGIGILGGYPDSNPKPPGPKTNNLPFVDQLGNQKKLGCLGDIEDEILPSCVGDYFINHELRIPSLNNQFFMVHVSQGFFCVAQLL